MELGVLLLSPLAGDVAPDLTFATMLADRAEVGPVGPELPTPEVFLDRGHPPEHLPRGETLDDPDQLAWAIDRNRLHEEVHVIPVGPDLQKGDLIPRGDLQAHVPEDRVDLRREDGSAVVRGADDVVEQDGDIVAPVDVFTHTSSLPQRPDAASRGV
jgi:hypothetical protein